MKILTLLATCFISYCVFADNRFDNFIVKADKYAMKDFSMFSFNIEQSFTGMDVVKLNDLFERFDKNWGYVLMAINMAQASSNSIGYVITKYNRCKPTDWEKIATELGITADNESGTKIDSLMKVQIRQWEKYEN